MIARMGRFMARIIGVYTPPVITTDFLIQESGSYLLLEDNLSKFELE